MDWNRMIILRLRTEWKRTEQNEHKMIGKKVTRTEQLKLKALILEQNGAILKKLECAQSYTWLQSRELSRPLPLGAISLAINVNRDTSNLLINALGVILLAIDVNTDSSK